jgi:hypothetical protein
MDLSDVSSSFSLQYLHTISYSNPTGMPRIPACSESAATLAVLHLNGALSAPAVESTLQGHIPTPYILTQTRLESNRNYILNLMGQEKEQPAEEVRANL